MEDIQQPTQPAEQVTPTTGPTQPSATEGQRPEPAAIEPVATEPVAPSEESFLRKNKTLIVGGIIALIVVTVAVGILLSLKNSEKLEGMIKIQENYIQEQPEKIPRK